MTEQPPADRRILRNRPVDKAMNLAGTPRTFDISEVDLVFTPDQLDELRASPSLPWLIDQADETATAARRVASWLRSLQAGSRECAICGQQVVGRADAIYCSATCRQRARRSRLKA